MTASAVYSASGSSGELQFANSDGVFGAAQAFWDASKSKLYVSGNLEVLGTETVIDTQHLQVEDAIIGLGTGSAGQGSAGDRGIIFLISGETNPSFYWDESANEFRLARVSNVPGDSLFADPTSVSNGGYGDIRLGIVNTVSGAMFDTEQRSVSDIGSDVFLYASGSADKRVVFGGDVVVSGTLFGGSPLKIGGELEFGGAAGGTRSLKNPSGSIKLFASNEVKMGSDKGTIRFIELGDSTAGRIYVTGSASPKTDRRFKLFSKGQIHLVGQNPAPEGLGSDIFVFVSGSIGSKVAKNRGVVMFGGDTLSSGSMYSLMGISGSLTKLHDGRSYLASSTDITISSASNGQVTITSNAQDQRAKFVYEVTSSHAAENVLHVPNLDTTSVNRDSDRIDVFVNGQLMALGDSKDYILGSPTGSVSFYFDLVDADIITVRTY